jgi:ATP-binding protein involved in chromosome partitioning
VQETIMTKISRAVIYDVLNSYQLPGTNSTLLALKAVKSMEVDGDRVLVELSLLDAYKDRESTIRKTLMDLLTKAGTTSVDVRFQWEPTPEVQSKNLLQAVKRCIMVGSGKGGVGKSTVAANLACAMTKQGLKVGLLDADLHGPSMGMMFGIKDGPEGTEDGKILPIEKFGLKLMSMAFLVDEDRPVIWRGPMLNKALTQFLGDVLWGELDVLLIDLPPGTGDIQLSLIQNAKVDGAVIVSTPQDVAFLDAKKAIGLFQTAKIPVVGLLENMSSFICPSCHTETQIFGHGGVKTAAQRMGLPFLGEVPIDLQIRTSSDEGTPIVINHPNSPQAKVFAQMAAILKTNLGL